MNYRTWLGFALALGIGVACRASGVPLPAPPVLVGALLVLAMTVGYVVTDRIAANRSAAERARCGGPTGRSGS